MRISGTGYIFMLFVSSIILNTGCVRYNRGDAGKEFDCWSFVEFEKIDPVSLMPLSSMIKDCSGNNPGLLSLMLLKSEVSGQVISMEIDMDSMEFPKRAEVRVDEEGLLDDDLLAVRYIVVWIRDGDGLWIVESCYRGECRRADMAKAGHPFFTSD